MKRILIAAIVALSLASCGRELDINVLTFNMRYENNYDGENCWANRRDRIVQMIKAERPDVIGSQELLAPQYAYMCEQLDQYGSVGVVREDGVDRGERSAIFYLRDRFTLLDTGNFWISEHPDSVGSKGWDAACERIATWAVLRDTVSHKEFFMMNVHTDHIGAVARREGVKLLLERCRSLSSGRPVILTGDFNATPDSEPITLVASSEYLVDSKMLAREHSGEEWTYNEFEKIDPSKYMLIDYIFLTPQFEVVSHAVLPQKQYGGMMSDHAPVKAHLILKN